MPPSESPSRQPAAPRTRLATDLKRYGVAIAVSLLAVALRLAFPEFLGRGNWFLQMHPAVLIAAWVGGTGPGLLATAIGSIAAAYFFVPPEWAFPGSPEELRLTFAAAFVGTLISGLTGALRESRSGARQAAIEAAAAQERYRRLLDLTPVAVFVNVTDRIVYANDAMQQLVETPLERLIGTSPLSLVHPDYRELVGRRIERMRSGDVSRVPWVHQVWRRPNGTDVQVEAAAAIVPWDSSTAIQVILRDVTRERAAAQEHARLLEEAQRANHVKDEFLATLSHELRTPLNVVLGWLHVLRHNDLPDRQRSDALEVIHRNTLAQARLVDDVLDLSRIVTGQLSIEREPVDVGATARASIDALSAMFAAKHQQVDLSADPGCIVIGDRHRLRQILWNVLSNAAKFTPDHGVITIRVAPADRMVEVVVTDTGQGVDPAFLPHMFEPFRQQDSGPARAHGGLGLGLALVKRLVEAHGGRVRAHSDGAGRGTTVAIELPAATPA